MRIKTKKLPDKLSALILLALDDLKKAERSKKYKVNMRIWHETNGRCTVCFAGSVMAFSLGADYKDSLDPFDFERETKNKLMALNEARKGSFGLATIFLDISKGKYPDPLDGSRDIFVPYYNDDRKGFHSTLRKAALDLKKARL